MRNLYLVPIDELNDEEAMIVDWINAALEPEPENNERSKQQVLFSGMDCLPGQTDLFDTDGEQPAPAQKHEPEIVFWEEAQTGDLVARGWLLFMRRLYRKGEARRIAQEEGGRVWRDGRSAWAVVVPVLK